MHTGGSPPLGYDVDPVTKKYVLNEEEAEVVRTIFQMTLENKHYSEILTCLNEKGCKTKAGNAFGKNSLFCILNNEKYTGVMIYNRTESRDPYTKKRNSNQIKPIEEQIRIPNGIPQIISTDIYDAVQKKIHSRKGRTKAIETYLLSGKIACGICGASYNGNRKTSSGNRNPVMTYRCATNANKGKSGCSNKEVNRNYLEKYILESIEKMLFADDKLDEVANHFQAYIKQMDTDTNNRIKSIQRSLQEYETKKKQLIKQLSNTNSVAVTQGIEAEVDEIAEKVTVLEEQLKEARAALNVDVPDKQTLKIYFQIAKKQLRSGIISEIREIIDRFVEKITVYPDRVEIAFKLVPSAYSQNSEDVLKTYAQNIAVLSRKNLKKYR